ncbi:MAG: GntR family transcriptional regulator [Phycisphaeraceae bacterium]
MAQQAGRKPTQQRELVGDLRRQIADRHLLPGTGLPSQQALMQRYRISRQTAQRALDRLAEEGFVRTEPRRGRFVTRYPPCHHRYGLVFSGHPEPIRSHHWTRLFAAQLGAARQFERDGPCQWAPYFNAGPEDEDAQRETHDRLERDLAEHRLAGLLFTVPPETLGLAERVARWPVPVVVMGGRPRASRATLLADRADFLQRATGHLVAQGRRQIAWLTQAKEPVDTVMEEVRRVCRVGDVTIRRDWIVPAHPYHPDWLAHGLEVLLDRPAEHRPDGLVIADDHLVEPAAHALAGLDVAVPDDLAVVGQWNWPLAYTAGVPVHLLGYNACEQLARAAKLLRTGTRGCHRLPVWTRAEFEGVRGVTIPLIESVEDASAVSCLH